jgi:hypothetical protein
MASTALVRVSGSVLSVPPARSGIIKNGARQGETWTIESVNILVADQNVTAVQLPRRDSTGVFETLPGVREVTKGELVDFLCEVSVYGQDAQVRVLEAWPDEDSFSRLAA